MSPMKICILTLGTRGDVELFITLGRELYRRGHRVLIGTSGFYAERVRSAGLHHRNVGLGTQEQMAGILRSLSEINDPTARTHDFVHKWIVPQLKVGMRSILPYATSADFFISNLKLALPRITQKIPTAFVTYDVPANVHDLARLVPGDGSHGMLDLVAMNQMLVDPDQMWGPQWRFTGFWIEPCPGSYVPPQELMRFLAEGPPPVVITLGSMSDMQAAGVTDRLIDAVHKAGQRAIIVDRGANAKTDLGNAFHPREEIPFQWLFSRCSAVIHHGGIGTVAASLACGTPSIMLPHISAQWRIAQTLRHAGVATGIFNAAATDADSLSTAIRQAVYDVQVKDAAGKWKGLLSQDRGAAAAADMIESNGISRRS